MKKFINENKFVIFLFSFSFFIRLIYILLIDTPIISDFKTMYDASQELINGTTNYKNMNYFLIWGYQMGHVIYQSFLLSINNSILFLKIMNCIITSLTVVVIYLFCNKVATNRSSKIISILYSLFPFPLYMNSVLSNQQLPLLLILIALYLFINIDYNRFIKRSLIIGILLGFSNILRSEVIVIIGSLFIFSLFLIKSYGLKKIVLSFMLIFVMYLSIFKGCSYILKVSNISPSGLDNLNPNWKFVIGFNYNTSGMYSESDASIYAYDSNLSKEEVINRVKDYKKIPLLFLRKTKILWLNSDLYWPIGHLDNTFFYKISDIINQIYIYLFVILSILSFKNLFKNKIQLLIFTILFLYFGTYLLIEVMPRYAYNLQVFEAILCSVGLDFIFSLKKNVKV